MNNTSSFKETTLSFPFKVSQSGGIATVDDQATIWSQRVISVIGTTIKERIMKPTFGSRLNELLWNTEGYAKLNVQTFVEQAFIKWLPTLTLDEVTVSDIDSSGILNISISYFLPNNASTQTTIGIVGISGNLPITEEIL
jgi:phage baseplate assembly protein W